MPPFKDELDPKSQAEIIAYVQWLTSDGRLPDAVISIQGGAGTALAGPSSEPAAVGEKREFLLTARHCSSIQPSSIAVVPAIAMPTKAARSVRI